MDWAWDGFSKTGGPHILDRDEAANINWEDDPVAAPSFQPMMRSTGSAIDRAGNLWWFNNWKPDFPSDARGNPGGDGVVIFVGLARPPSS